MTRYRRDLLHLMEKREFNSISCTKIDTFFSLELWGLITILWIFTDFLLSNYAFTLEITALV